MFHVTAGTHVEAVLCPVGDSIHVSLLPGKRVLHYTNEEAKLSQT